MVLTQSGSGISLYFILKFQFGIWYMTSKFNLSQEDNVQLSIRGHLSSFYI